MEDTSGGGSTKNTWPTRVPKEKSIRVVAKRVHGYDHGTHILMRQRMLLFTSARGQTYSAVQDEALGAKRDFQCTSCIVRQITNQQMNAIKKTRTKNQDINGDWSEESGWILY